MRTCCRKWASQSVAVCRLSKYVRQYVILMAGGCNLTFFALPIQIDVFMWQQWRECPPYYRAMHRDVLVHEAERLKNLAGIMDFMEHSSFRKPLMFSNYSCGAYALHLRRLSPYLSNMDGMGTRAHDTNASRLVAQPVPSASNI